MADLELIKRRKRILRDLCAKDLFDMHVENTMKRTLTNDFYQVLHYSVEHDEYIPESYEDRQLITLEDLYKRKNIKKKDKK